MNHKSTIVFSLLILISLDSFGAKRPVISESYSTLPARTATDFRSSHRMGLGLQAAGALGIGGLVFEVNLTRAHSFGLGWGGGSGFQSVYAEWRNYFGGEVMMPFFSLGFSKWTNNEKNGPISETTPQYLSDRLMSDFDKSRGVIDESLLFPSVGLQYVVLSGPWAGASVYAQILMLIDVRDFEAAPTGSVGSIYYF